MRVMVRYFASFRDLAGTEREEMELEDGADIVSLLELLAKAHPGLGSVRDVALFSVNLEFADRDRVLADGDEVGLLPPISGG